MVAPCPQPGNRRSPRPIVGVRSGWYTAASNRELLCRRENRIVPPQIPVSRRVAAGPNDAAALPDYEHPPVVEVSLGVQWTPALTDVGDAARALLRALGAEWTSCRRAENGLWTLTNLLQDGRIEVEPQSLRVAWLGHEGSRYPHYEPLRDSFVAAWVALQNDAGSLPAVSWSVRYVNRIPQGTVWHTPADWTFCRLVPPLQVPTASSGVRSLSLRYDFPLCEDRGELMIHLHQGQADEPAPDCLWLELTSGGPVASGETALLDGLDFGRQTIVRTFRELMSPQANAFWGLQS